MLFFPSCDRIRQRKRETMEKEVIGKEQFESVIQQYIKNHPEIKTEYRKVHQGNIDCLTLAMEMGTRPTDFFDYEFTDQAGNHYSIMISNKLSDFGIEGEDSHLAFCDTVAIEIYQNYRSCFENEELPYDARMLAIYDLDFNEIVEVIQYSKWDVVRYLKNQYQSHHLSECIDDINMCALKYVDRQEIETETQCVTLPREVAIEVLDGFFQWGLPGIVTQDARVLVEAYPGEGIAIEGLYQILEDVITSQSNLNTVSGYFLSSIRANYLQLLFGQYLMFCKECGLHLNDFSEKAIRTPEYARYNQNNQWLRSYEETRDRDCRAFCYELPAFRELISSIVAEHLFQMPQNGKEVWSQLFEGTTENLNHIMHDLGIDLAMVGNTASYDIRQVEPFIQAYYQKYQNTQRKTYRLF